MKIMTQKDILLRILRKSKDGVSREELRDMMQINDRLIRQYIAELRNEGHMIGVTAQGGYTINKVRDFDRVIALYEARVRKENKTLKAMKRARELKDNVGLSI